MRPYLDKKIIAIFFFAIIFMCSLSRPNLSASGSNYPTNKWHVSTPEEQGMESKTLLKMMKAIVDKKYNIHSVIIVRNGDLVMDAYLYPFKLGQKHELHSVTKSVISALIGIAIDKGYIKDVHHR